MISACFMETWNEHKKEVESKFTKAKVNIIFKKYEEKDAFFDPRQFLEEFAVEKYFELLIGVENKEQKEIFRRESILKFWPV